MPAEEFSIRVLFDRAQDGRYYVHSPNVTGLHLAGTDIDLMRKELEPIVKDLLWFNHQLIIDEIRWVPSLDNVVNQLKDGGTETYLVRLRAA
jgi:hypothetical protein